MKTLNLAVLFLFFGVSANAETPYGSCSATAQSYQQSYESNGQASDLVCYQKALEREMSGSVPYDCPLSAQHYQDAYSSSGRSNDLVCYQESLQRELQ